MSWPAICVSFGPQPSKRLTKNYAKIMNFHSSIFPPPAFAFARFCLKFLQSTHNMINETLSFLTVACSSRSPSPLGFSNVFAVLLCNLLNVLLAFFAVSLCFSLRLLCICVLSGLKLVRELSALHIAAQNWHCHLQIHFYLYRNEFIVAVNGHNAFTSCPKNV